MANSNRRNNSISTLLIDGELSTDQTAIGEAITQFYTGLYMDEVGWRPKLDKLDFPILSNDDAGLLVRPFDEEEVVGVMKGFNGDKAPGPDGFPMAFFQVCWDIILYDIMEVIKYFHARGTFVTSLNATFLTLISKKTEAIEVKDFRPISLVGGVYKIVSKVLANRLISAAQIDFNLPKCFHSR